MRFSPRRIERWIESGRGTGIYENYQPFHQVTRSDPGSRGRSRIFFWHRHGRPCHFLSDCEFVTFLCAHLLDDLVDCREQFPLSHLAADHELTHYSETPEGRQYPGTLVTAGQLGFPHPLIRGQPGHALWPMTTDLVIARGARSHIVCLQAVAVKRVTPTSRRTWELLAIEERYWRARGVRWQLVTAEDFECGVFVALMATAAYALSEWQAPVELIEVVSELALRLEGSSLQRIFAALHRNTGLQPDEAARVFWQAVWRRRIPFDLRLPIRASTPLRLVDADTFRHFNPLERENRS